MFDLFCFLGQVNIPPGCYSLPRSPLPFHSQGHSAGTHLGGADEADERGRAASAVHARLQAGDVQTLNHLEEGTRKERRTEAAGGVED